MLLAAVPAFAQEAPPMDAPRNLNPVEKFIGALKLDEKTQVPAVAKIFDDVRKDAGPVATELLQIRNRMVNAELAGKADDLKAATDAYGIAAAKMAALEAKAMGQIVPLLKPDQKSRIPQAYQQMAGFFQSAAPAARGGRPSGAGDGGDTGGAAGGGGRGGGR
jgi:hypothetical protein